MSSREIARQWFIPGEGIDRHVISADIQRYLGNDATVRPGMGTGDNEVRPSRPALHGMTCLLESGCSRILDQGVPKPHLCTSASLLLTGRSTSDRSSQAMLADLRADSVKWRQEQRMTGTRGSYSPTISTMPRDYST